MNAEDTERISHRTKNKTQININIVYSCTSTYLAKIASQCAISTMFPHLPPIHHPFRMHIHFSMGETEAQQSEMIWGLYLILFLSPQIKQQNTSYKKSAFVSIRQKTVVQSQCYIASQ